MARSIYVDSDSIQTAIDMLKKSNADISGSFESMGKVAKTLECWEGKGGEAAKTKIYDILTRGDERRASLDSIISFLENQVNPNYINAENTNRKLADNFK